MNQKDLFVEYVSVASLIPNKDNPRVHSHKQLRQLAENIKTFGCIVPLLVDGDLQVIAGHGRLLASKRLGLARVPVIRLEHLSEHQRRAFMIADNRLAENSEWDDRLLGEQLKILSEAEIDFSVELSGFDMTEIDMRIENLAANVEGESDPADAFPEPCLVAVTQPGDVWELGKHRMLCGDALIRASYQQLMGDHRASMMFTDPPYNVRISGHATGNGNIQHREFPMASGELNGSEFTDFLSVSLTSCREFSRDGSLHYVCMDWRHLTELLAAGRAVYPKLVNMCVWVKDNAGMGSFYRSQHELVFVFENGTNSYRNNVQLGRFGRSRANVWQYPGVNSFARATDEGNLLALHPTVKPVALVADAIMDCSARGDIVLDPFLGSGTTVIAAERTGRTCYGLELDPGYVDTCVRRWQRFTGSEAVHRGSGQTFAQREREVSHVWG